MSTVVDYSTIRLTDKEFNEYLDVVGFAISKGTANVSTKDKKKLRPLLKHYAKMKHPFTACVKDNRKRFGSATEEYCAVLKDLIVGSTKWRGKGKKYTPKNLSESFEDFNVFLTDELEFENEVPEDFLEFLNNLTDEDISNMTGSTIIAENTDLAQGDVVWKPERSLDYIRRQLQEILNESYSNYADGEVGGYQYWVEDIQDNQALVCHKYNDYYVVPFSQTSNGLVIADQDEWTTVEKAWVEANLSEEPQVMAEMYFDSSETTIENDVIWKTIMREGTWKFSPGPGQKAVAKPIKVVKSGQSDPKKLIISLEEVMNNYKAGAKEHVTIPTSHDDKVLENTGFIKDLKIDVDEEGRAVLKAAHNFTEPEVKEKARRGTIANTSAGILFDYIKKETGEKFNAVLGHVALTNSPWLNGMEPFGGVNAGEELEIISFSEESEVTNEPDKSGQGDTPKNSSTVNEQGGEIVSTLEETKTFFDELGLSEDEVKERLNRLEAVEAENKRNNINSKCKAWQDEGKSPAIIKEAKAALLSDSGTVAVNLSEDGQSKSITLSEMVERLVAASPTVNLTDDPVDEKDVTDKKPATDASDENIVASLSEAEKVQIGLYMFDDAMPEKEAIAKVLEARKSE